MSIAHEVVSYLRRLATNGGKVGNWTVKKSDHLDRGGMGLVLFGSRLDMRGQTVRAAIKFQLPLTYVDGSRLSERHAISTQRFAHEFDVLEWIKRYTTNPPIVRPLDNGMHGFSIVGRRLKIPYFVQERLDGPNLQQLVQYRGPLRDQQWLSAAHSLLHASRDMHAVRVIHQDIKPPNVMLHEGRFTLIDLGLASFIDQRDPGDAGGLTIGYGAPEQHEAMFSRSIRPSEFKGHVDVYAVGTTLVFAAQARAPWDDWVDMARTHKLRDVQLLQYLHNGMKTHPPNLSGLTSMQRRIVAPMLEPLPENRPTAEEALSEVVALGSGTRSQVQMKGRPLAPGPGARAVDPQAASPASPRSAPGGVAGQDGPPRRAIARRSVEHREPPHQRRVLPQVLPGGAGAPTAGATSSIRWLGDALLLILFAGVSIYSLGLPLVVVAYQWFSRAYRPLDFEEKAYINRRTVLGTLPVVGAAVGTLLAVRGPSPLLRALGALLTVSNLALMVASSLNSSELTVLTLAVSGLTSALIGYTLGRNMRKGLVGDRGAHLPTRQPTDQGTGATQDARAFAEDASGRPAFRASWRDIMADLYTGLHQNKRSRFIIDCTTPQVQGLFLQGYFEEDGSATVEAAADLSTRPKITVGQYEALLALGWEPPSRDIPNFICFLDRERSTPEGLASFFLSTLRDGYRLDPEGLAIHVDPA